MNREMQSIIHNLQQVNNGEPWFGRPVYAILDEVDASKVYIKLNNTEHSLIELLYHMLTWAEFTLKRIEKDSIQDMAVFEKMIPLLDKKGDEFLKKIVDYRKYNFRFLLN